VTPSGHCTPPLVNVSKSTMSGPENDEWCNDNGRVLLLNWMLGEVRSKNSSVLRRDEKKVGRLRDDLGAG
jgi:hypothetical protein